MGFPGLWEYLQTGVSCWKISLEQVSRSYAAICSMLLLLLLTHQHLRKPCCTLQFGLEQLRPCSSDLAFDAPPSARKT